ncbi:ArpU family phage packaging/lysis transcriptional regulator [Tetragenococcus halophilus]|uniref:ArpU family phage packaging/lysis transcriptional regulator n=1 Tax=Tetragenococcus halophilus TaxID=51669 RepID=UPI0030F1B2D4
MGLLRDVDFFQTRRNARKCLAQYRRLQRITGKSKIDIKSPIITDMPKSPSQGNRAEDALIQHMDAEAEQSAIVSGLMSLGLTKRTILYLSFCDQERWTGDEISREIDYSRRQMNEFKNEALIEFAEAYRHGRLIAFH